MKIFSISKLLRKICRIIVRYTFVCPPPLTHRTSNLPPPGRLSEITGTDISCPDEKLSYTKVAQNGSTIKNTIPIPSPHPSNIPHMRLSPPPDRLSGNHPGPVKLLDELRFIRNVN